MKRALFILLGIMLCISAHAQSDSLRQAYSRIQVLEQTIANQNSTIDQLTARLNKMEDRHLIMEKNLILTPVVAKAKVHDDVEYSVKEVSGDPATGAVQMTITVDNIGNTDKTINYWNTEIQDERGNGYDDKGRVVMRINGVSDNIIRQQINHHPNTPYNIYVTINGYDKNAQYIKRFMIDALDGAKHSDVVFQNLRINWQSE